MGDLIPSDFTTVEKECRGRAKVPAAGKKRQHIHHAAGRCGRLLLNPVPIAQQKLRALLDTVQTTEETPIRAAVLPTIGSAPHDVNRPGDPSAR